MPIRFKVLEDTKKEIIIKDEYKFRTPSFSLDREMELGILKYREFKEQGICDELINYSLQLWEIDPNEYIRDYRVPTYFAYVSMIWCELSKVSWKTEDILKIDNIDNFNADNSKGAFLIDERFSPVIKDLNEFLKKGGTLVNNMETGVTLEQFWFLKTYMFKLPYFCLINKNYRHVPSKRIEYKFFASSWGMSRFLHHLMLWENENDPELLEGAPFKNHILKRNDFIPGMKPDTNNIFPCLIFDGKELGHAIEILYWNKTTRKFVYHDPWPFGTLLNNVDEVNASLSEKVGYLGEELWEVSPAELDRVIFSILMPFKITNFDFLHYGTETKYFLIPYEKMFVV
jgi:hypothetical protein